MIIEESETIVNVRVESDAKNSDSELKDEVY
jgi:hypothetical protein